ncbi:hypothetical protein CK203_050037 [Vitis vinifera]|uniref:Uncharacterized protein n=1 Tax=Vitis vinifera TaxID=29760 RepID=A0A438H4E8_VITVI|nr:hypothetical protein CK203_050037 [Vitis vinifera]
MGYANFEGVMRNFRITWSSWLPKAISSSFQLQIVHGLKRWILDFKSFEMLAEITDTMASLRDAILGLGQRINGHQAQPLPIPGSTPHDSTTPPPPPPPSGPTIQQDYIVPPPPVQIEQRMSSLHVSDGIMSWDGYDDLLVVALPVKFHKPDIERYTG